MHTKEVNLPVQYDRRPLLEEDNQVRSSLHRCIKVMKRKCSLRNTILAFPNHLAQLTQTVERPKSGLDILPGLVKLVVFDLLPVLQLEKSEESIPRLFRSHAGFSYPMVAAELQLLPI